MKTNKVRCLYCGKMVPAKDAKSYFNIKEDKEPRYYCSANHAVLHLFGTIPKTTV